MSLGRDPLTLDLKVGRIPAGGFQRVQSEAFTRASSLR